MIGSQTPPRDILAFDFDGVLCDGLPEYFQSAWQTYCQIWQHPTAQPPDTLEAAFGRLRPVIETGWEMPLLIQALVQGIDETAILADWGQIAAHLLTQAPVAAPDLAQHLDHLRDLTIQTDLEGWLGLHRFYPQALDCLRSQLAPQSTIQPVIISTKEGRFIKQLLAQQGIALPDTQIYGKEVRASKAKILQDLIADSKLRWSKTTRRASQPGAAPIQVWFIEDRLKTLLAIREQTALNEVELFLADWGYNTPQERQSAQETSHGIHLLSLAEIAHSQFPPQTVLSSLEQSARLTHIHA